MFTSNPFKPATKEQSKLRLALMGPSGSGKTYTALAIASELGKLAVIDTERGSASKYADLFQFDVLELTDYHPNKYIEAIKAAEAFGYEVILIDSLTHAWAGENGVLNLVDKAAKRSQSQNTFAAWRDATPLHNALIEAMVGSKVHIVATMRSKVEYVIERDERTGKSMPRKVGMAPVQRDGMEYEFDIVGEMDTDNTLLVSKSRCIPLSGAVITKPGVQVAQTIKGWLTDGTPQNVTTLPSGTQAQPLFNGTAALQPQPVQPPQQKPDLTIVQTPPNVPKDVAKNALNGTPVRRVPPAAKDDHPWCEWCGDVPSSPGEPCHKCVQLGATKKDGWNGGNRKPAEALQTFVPEGHIAFHTARFSKPKTKEIVTFIGGTTAMDHIEVSEYVEDGVIGALGIKGYPYEFIQAWNDKQQIQHRDYPLSPNMFASVTIKGGNGQDRNNRRIGEIKPLKQLEEDGDAEPEDRHHKAVATAARGFVDGSKKGVIFKTNVGEIKVYSREEMRRDLSEAWVEYAGQLKDKPGENHTFVLDGMPDLEVLYVVRKSSKPGERATEYKQVVGYRALSIDTPVTDDADVKF